MATRWRAQFNRADGVSKDLIAEIDSSSPSDSRVRKLQRDLDAKVHDLKQLLDDIEEDSDEDSTVGRGELQRMRQEYQTLKQLCDDVKSGRRAPTKAKHRDERAALMSAAAPSPAYGASSGDGAAAPAISDREVMLTQERKIDEQNRLLEKLDSGADDLQELSYGISDETDKGTALLSSLERNVDDAHTGLNREARRADYVAQQTNNCWMYGVIALEIGALVLMLILHKGL